MQTSVKYYLGIDWGRSKIGLAIADSETRIASALKEVNADDVFSELKKINAEQPICKIVLGIVDDARQYSNQNSLDTQKMGNCLIEAGFEVAYEKEFMSTKLAQSNLATTGQKGISKADNSEAARIILQSWLDKLQ